MRIETQEWIHNTAHRIISAMVESMRAHGSFLTPDDQERLDRAENWLSYVDQHYKPDEIKE